MKCYCHLGLARRERKMKLNDKRRRSNRPVELTFHCTYIPCIIVLHLNLLLYTFFFRKIFIFVPKQKSFISSLVINLLFEDLLSKKTATVINFDSFLWLLIRNHHLRVQYLHILSMFFFFFLRK